MNRAYLAFAAGFIALNGCAQQSRLSANTSSAPTPALQIPLAEVKRPVNQLALLTRWLQGEFDNNAFVVQQISDAQATATGLPEHPVERMHVRISNLERSKLGQNWFLVFEAYPEDSKQAHSVRLYQLSENDNKIKMRGYTIIESAKLAQIKSNPLIAAQLSQTDLRADPVDCMLHWQFQALSQQFASDVTPSQCPARSMLTGGAALSAAQISYGSRNRFDRARIFQISGQISRSLKSPVRTGKYSSVTGLTVHDQGGRMELPMDNQGTPSGFALKLEQIPATTGLGGLHLSVLNTQTGAVEGEAWTDRDADSLGLNLNWMRISVTADAPAPE